MDANYKSNIELIHNKEDKLYYNCTDCDSEIEILSIKDNGVSNLLKFECKNKHKKEISVNDYFKQMKISKINKDTCFIHEGKCICYCLDCKMHLCNGCLKSRDHINHNKNNIIEIAPDNIDLDFMKDIINYYNTNINELENKNKIQFMNYKNEFIKLINKENKSKDNLINKLNKEETNELNLNKNIFINNILEIQKKYNNEIIKLKNKFYDDYNNIEKKYKIHKDKILIRYNNNINKIKSGYDNKLNNLESYQKINNYKSLKLLNEIVYNTYNKYNNNYYNSLNINNLLLSYLNNKTLLNIIFKSKLKENLQDYINKLQKYNNNSNFEQEKNNLINKYNDTINKTLEKNNKIINIMFNHYNKNNNNEEITLLYQLKKDNFKNLEKEAAIQIFGYEFVKNNKDKCKILYEGKEYELQSSFKYKDINNNHELLEIKLININNITDIRFMFKDCHDLLFLPDIYNINTSKFNSMVGLFVI